MSEKRLIDANALIERIKYTFYDHERVRIDTVTGTFLTELCSPTVDAVEVVHGRWERGVCTNCEFDLRCLTDGENDLEQWVWDEGFNYCPNCGAKMDGD